MSGACREMGFPRGIDGAMPSTTQVQKRTTPARKRTMHPARPEAVSSFLLPPWRLPNAQTSL
jgi:hypothetical protein